MALQFAPSTYWSAKSRPPSARSQRREELKPEILSVFEENYQVYGAQLWIGTSAIPVTVARPHRE